MTLYPHFKFLDDASLDPVYKQVFVDKNPADLHKWFMDKCPDFAREVRSLRVYYTSSRKDEHEDAFKYSDAFRKKVTRIRTKVNRASSFASSQAPIPSTAPVPAAPVPLFGAGTTQSAAFASANNPFVNAASANATAGNGHTFFMNGANGFESTAAIPPAGPAVFGAGTTQTQATSGPQANTSASASSASASASVAHTLPPQTLQWLFDNMAQLSQSRAEEIFQRLRQIEASPSPGWEQQLYTEWQIPGDYVYNREDTIDIVQKVYQRCVEIRSAQQPLSSAAPAVNSQATTVVAAASTDGSSTSTFRPAGETPAQTSTDASSTSEAASGVAFSEGNGHMTKLLKANPNALDDFSEEGFNTIIAQLQKGQQAMQTEAEKQRQERQEQRQLVDKTVTKNAELAENTVKTQDKAHQANMDRLKDNELDILNVMFKSPALKRTKSAATPAVVASPAPAPKRCRTENVSHNASGGSMDASATTRSSTAPNATIPSGTAATPRRIIRAIRPGSVTAAPSQDPISEEEAPTQDPIPQKEHVEQSTSTSYPEEEVEQARVQFRNVFARAQDWEAKRASLDIKVATKLGTDLLTELDGLPPALKQDVALNNQKKQIIKWIEQETPDNETVDPASLRPRVGEGAYSQQAPQQVAGDLGDDPEL